MKQNFLSTTVVAVALVLALGCGLWAAPVAAQEQPDENESNATTSEQAEPEIKTGDDYQQQIDNSTRITNWEYRPGMFTITLEADDPTKISMTEAGDFERGTGTFNYREVQLQEGTNTVTMPVTDRQGAGVAIATRASLEQGGGAFVSVGQVQRNPFRHFGGETGLFSGVILTVSLAAVGAAYVVRSEDSGVQKA